MSRAAKGGDCKSLVYDFVGSSPSSPTNTYRSRLSEKRNRHLELTSEDSNGSTVSLKQTHSGLLLEILCFRYRRNVGWAVYTGFDSFPDTRKTIAHSGEVRRMARQRSAKPYYVGSNPIFPSNMYRPRLY